MGFYEALIGKNKMEKDQELLFISELYMALTKTIEQKKAQVEAISDNIDMMEKEQIVLLNRHRDLQDKK